MQAKNNNEQNRERNWRDKLLMGFEMEVQAICDNCGKVNYMFSFDPREFTLDIEPTNLVEMMKDRKQTEDWIVIESKETISIDEYTILCDECKEEVGGANV